MTVPESVVAILRQLEEAGHETWCVGGAIRDALLGDPQQDVDLATAAPPAAVRQLFRRTVPIGIEHGTVGVLDDAGTLHEVTTFRRDVRTDGRHAVVEFGVDLDADLARRDFTINAIAYHPLRHAWRDPFDGGADIRSGTLRAVGDAAQRFHEDRLRILRALRFTARFGLEIAPDTWTAAVAQARDTAHLSAERVRDEWIKGIATTRSLDRLVALWRDSGVAAVWLPHFALAPDVSLRYPKPAPLAAASGAIAPTRDPVLVTAFCCAPSAPVWRRLKGSTAEIRRAEAIDRGPARPVSAEARDVRRWMAAVGTAADDLAALAEWRGDAADGWLETMAGIRARGEATSRGELAVTGNDLLLAGVQAGPHLGAVLGRLLDAVLDDPARNTRDALLALARESA